LEDDRHHRHGVSVLRDADHDYARDTYFAARSTLHSRHNRLSLAVLDPHSFMVKDGKIIAAVTRLQEGDE
jgi:hypothetical protein